MLGFGRDVTEYLNQSSGSHRAVIGQSSGSHRAVIGPQPKCAGETGKKWAVQVRCDEGAANRIAPEPCTGSREAAGEALTGARIGQPSRPARNRKLSREKSNPGCRRRLGYARQHGRARHASVRPIRRRRRPWPRFWDHDSGTTTFDPEMAASGCPGGRGRHVERGGSGARRGDLTVAGHYLSAHRVRSAD